MVVVDSPRLSERAATILRVFLAEPDTQFTGLDLAEQTGLLPGTSYPILLRLQQAGWITAHWQTDPDDASARRRYYRSVSANFVEASRALARYEAAQTRRLVQAPGWCQQ
jgi:PadR family transcriptional regulator, regulatory protein PadR